MLGCRLNTQLTGAKIETFAKNAKKIVVDVDEAELTKNNGVKIDLKINLELNDFFEKIKNLKYSNENYDSWIDKINQWKKEFPVCLPDYFNQSKK